MLITLAVISDQNGSPKTMAECVRCADGLTPNPAGNACVPCHPSFPKAVNGTCQCPKLTHSSIDGICFPNAEISEPQVDKNSLYKVEYESGPPVVSQFFRDNLLSSFYLCKVSQDEHFVYEMLI